MVSRYRIAFLAVLAGTTLFSVSSAAAQDQRTPNKPPETTGSASTSPQGVPQAPVGHRQPRAADLPADRSTTAEDDRRSQLDRELDQKLRICRGC